MAIHSIVDLVQALDNVFARKGSSGLPAGGTKGKFLRKKSATDGDAEWADPIYHYKTIAQVNAAVANGDVPVGAYISCDENSPSGIAGDSTLSPTSENWVQNKVITLKINGVESVLATVNTGTTADQAYAEGDFILMDGTNVLYKAISAIAQGASFTTGSGGNVEQTTIGAVLKALASSAGATSLSALTDTDISSPADGRPLIYDNATSKWKNGEAVIRGTELASNSSYSNQTVIGKYNKNGSSNLFEIGNGTGTSNNSRYNALEVSSYGQVIIGGSPDVGGKLFRRRKVSDNINRYPYISGEEFAYWINGSTGTTASQDFKRGELLVFDADGGLYVVDDGSGSTNLEEVVIHSGDTFVAKTYPHYSSGYNLIPATGFVAAPSTANFSQIGILNVLRNIWGSLFEKVSNKSNVQVNSTDKYPSSALVYAMNQNLGDPSSASAVTGADAFSKIGQLSSDLVYKASFTKRITVSQTSVGYIGETLISSMTGYDYSKWSKRKIVSVYATFINDPRYSATWSLRNSDNTLNIETFFAGDFDVVLEFLYTK